MYVIGLTGGIASGKTTAAESLRSFGAQVVDADAISRKLTSRGGAAVDAVMKRFDTIDRKKLADIIFSDEKARADLNAIVHPLVQYEMERQIALSQIPVVVLDVPLLFESNMDNLADEVWVVHVPRDEQIRRLGERDGLTREEAEARIDSQMTTEEKIARADFAIDTSGPPIQTRARLHALYREARKKAAHARPRPMPAPLKTPEPEPDSTAQTDNEAESDADGAAGSDSAAITMEPDAEAGGGADIGMDPSIDPNADSNPGPAPRRSRARSRHLEESPTFNSTTRQREEDPFASESPPSGSQTGYMGRRRRKPIQMPSNFLTDFYAVPDDEAEPEEEPVPEGIWSKSRSPDPGEGDGKVVYLDPSAYYGRSRNPTEEEASDPYAADSWEEDTSTLLPTPNRHSFFSRQRPVFWVVAAVLLVALLVLVGVIGVGAIQDLNERRAETRRLEQIAEEKARYKLEYKDLIDQYAAQNALDPALVAAVIYNESRFSPTAVSRVGARGLMQIMEKTGGWIAEVLDEEATYAFDNMFVPEDNIRFGTWYLGFLSRMFDGDMVKMAAGYHAGQNDVVRWLQNPEYSSDGQTLEKIPIPETAQYVQKVVSTYEIYKRHYYPDPEAV